MSIPAEDIKKLNESYEKAKECMKQLEGYTPGGGGALGGGTTGGGGELTEVLEKADNIVEDYKNLLQRSFITGLKNLKIKYPNLPSEYEIAYDSFIGISRNMEINEQSFNFGRYRRRRDPRDHRGSHYGRSHYRRSLRR